LSCVNDIEIVVNRVSDVRTALRTYGKQLVEQAELGKSQYCLSLDKG